MFIGAMLDCFPEHADSLTEQINLAGFEEMVSLRHEPFSDGILSGHKFDVEPTVKAESHHHRHYHEIESILKGSDLDEKTRAAALEIFKIIAIAEAKIHNTSIESVSFHEVGAWDSIADVVCAAYLIAQSDIRSTSVSSLPLGGGQVKTAHGTLPVPAPATALILEDFKFTDDGITGERITPTGAAILKYLNPKKPPRVDLSGKVLVLAPGNFQEFQMSCVFFSLNPMNRSYGRPNQSAKSNLNWTIRRPKKSQMHWIS